MTPPCPPHARLRRAVYRLGHPLARLWWCLRRPAAHGASVAVWWRGRLLVVRYSYRRGVGLPGGGGAAGETPRATAARELAEELGLVVPPAALTPVGDWAFPLERRWITDSLFAWRPPSAPVPRPDPGELLWAAWLTPAELRRRGDAIGVLACYLAMIR